jgi:hypothetical protein
MSLSIPKVSTTSSVTSTLNDNTFQDNKNAQSTPVSRTPTLLDVNASIHHHKAETPAQLLADDETASPIVHGRVKMSQGKKWALLAILSSALFVDILLYS